MKITIKVEEQGKRGRWKAIKVWEYKTRNMEFIKWMVGKNKSFETRRLRTCSWRRKGDNSREREKKRKTDLFKQTLKVMFHIITSLWVVFGLIRWLLHDDVLWPHIHMLVCNALYGLLLCAYICAFEKKMVTYLGKIKPQSRKDRKYTWQKTARIWCHNFETNGRS